MPKQRSILSTLNSDIVLTASTASSYQWYKDGMPINDATSNPYTAVATGVYTVVTFSAEECASVQSSSQALIITGLDDVVLGTNVLYPNPASVVSVF